MKNIIKGIIKKELSKRHQVIKVQTPKEKVVSFIEKLHPYQVDKGLIRVGPNKDGGYLVPNDLDGIKACFSPGVDKVSEFELYCLKNGMQIYLADKSVDRVNLDIPETQYSFIKKYVGCTNNDDYITLDDWVNLNLEESDSDLLLQMDIEGGEYDTLINTSDLLINRFRIMVIEFHHLQKLWDTDFFHFAEIVFNKILQTHLCVHIHPNNCCGIDYRYGIEIPRIAEFTFLRKDRLSAKIFAKTFPHELDFDNTNKEHIKLPENWYKH